MGLHNTAHYLKSKGRNADTELVHMSKGEVQALKTMARKHGGDLTTNPETGLPEAGFLSSVLPMVAGIGLDVLTDGAMTPLLSGMLVGGADYAMTGSITKGLMAGLGAYGGADLSGAFAGAGADLAPAGDVTAESEADPTRWGSADTSGKAILDTPPPASRAANAWAGLTGPTAMSTLGSNTGAAMMAAAPILSDAMTTNRSTIPTATSTNTNPFGLKTLSPNFQGMFPAQPNPAYQAKYPNYQQNPYQAPSSGIVGMAAGGSVPSYNGDSPYGSVVGIENATQQLEDLYGHRPIISTPTPSVGIVQDTDPNTRNLSPYEAALYRVKQKASAAGLGKNAIALPAASSTYGKINPDATPEVQEAAGGGITGTPSLSGYAAGGNPRLLKGPGDGMSDSIPANIGGKQPARLADGEFVVPADVVSHLGNGSTDAGAKKLYSMMDNIRRARTGRKKQAPAVKADKYLPK